MSTKKIRGKKLGKVKTPEATDEVSGTKGAEGVSGVKNVGGVGRVGAAGRVKGQRATRVMTKAERDKLFGMIQEEAEQLFGNSPQREVVEQAVKMAIDASLVDEDEAENSETKKGRSKNKP